MLVSLRRALVISVLGLIVGCSTRSVVTSALNNASDKGVVYHLPKTLVKVTVPYTVVETIQFKNGIPIGTPSKAIKVEKAIQLTPFNVPDPQNAFTVSGDGVTDDIRFDATFKFEVSENQLLLGVQSDITDKSPEVLQSLTSAGISIAKLIAMAGNESDLPSPLKEIYVRLMIINSELAALAQSNDLKRQEKIDLLMKEQASWLEVVKAYFKNNEKVTKETDVNYIAILDPGDTKQCTRPEGEVHIECKLQAPSTRLQNFPTAQIPEIRVMFLVNKSQFEERIISFFDDKRQSENGILYRVPLRRL